MGKKKKSKEVKSDQNELASPKTESISSESLQEVKSEPTEKTYRGQPSHQQKGKNLLGRAQKQKQLKKEVEKKKQKYFTWEEVGQHDRRDDAWVVIQENVYDVKKLIDIHPGGVRQVVQRAGRDATKTFKDANHPPKVFQTKLGKWKVGLIDPESIIEAWQKERFTGKIDVVFSISLATFLFGIMIYLVI